MNASQTVVDDELMARVAWSRLIEPGDVVAGVLVQALGAARALAWARAHAPEYGGNPDAIFVAGGSSGANLAAVAALTGTEVRVG